MVLGFTTGCSDKVPLKGKVVFSDNDEPVTEGMIFFESGSFQARGNIDKSGNYYAETLSTRDGIPKGEYHVTVSGVTKKETIGPEFNPDAGHAAPVGVVDPRRLKPGQTSMAGVLNTPLVHTKYLKSDTTDIIVTIDGSTKTLDIRLDRYEH